MKKLTYGLMLLLVAAFLIMGCTENKKEVKEYKIGAIHALSGNNAVYGESMRRGMDLALEEQNLDVNHKFIISYEDHQANPTIALSALEKLKSLDNTVIITSFTNVILALSPVAKENNMLLVNSGATGRDLKNVGVHLINTVPDSEFEVSPLAKYCIDKGFKTAAILYVNYQFGVDQSDIFEKEYTKLGGQIVIKESSVIDNNDFRTQLIKIKEKKPDVLFIATLAKETTQIVKQAKEIGINSTMITTQTSISTQSLKEISNYSNGLIVSGPKFDLENKDPKFMDFKNKYFSKYGVLPDYFATTYYDSTYLVMEAIKNCDSDKNVGCILNYLTNVVDYEGASGKTTFIGTTVSKPIDIKIFIDDNLKTID